MRRLITVIEPAIARLRRKSMPASVKLNFNRPGSGSSMDNSLIDGA